MMIPGDVRLLGTARQAGQRLAAMVDDPEARSLVDAIDIVLNELALRKDDAFFAGWRCCAKGKRWRRFPCRRWHRTHRSRR